MVCRTVPRFWTAPVLPFSVGLLRRTNWRYLLAGPFGKRQNSAALQDAGATPFAQTSGGTRCDRGCRVWRKFLVKARFVLFAILIFSQPSVWSQVQIQFDYRFDSSGFFDAPERRAVLNAAANEFSSRLTDSLSPIISSGSNTWNALVIRPDTGTMELLADIMVPANTVTIFVGGRSLGTDLLGIGEVGGLSLQGAADWRELVRARGQSGAPFNDFGPWGGSIGFDSNPATDWYFDPDPLSLDDLPPETDDFFTVAQHELGHLFGIGFAASWSLQSESGLFAGPNSSLVFEGPVPLDSSGNHWADGTISRVFGTDVVQETLMAPELAPGTRKFLTDLDMAGLRDIGWTVVPEPEVVVLFAVGLGTVLLRFGNNRNRQV